MQWATNTISSYCPCCGQQLLSPTSACSYNSLNSAYPDPWSTVGGFRVEPKTDEQRHAEWLLWQPSPDDWLGQDADWVFPPDGRNTLPDIRLKLLKHVREPLAR